MFEEAPAKAQPVKRTRKKQSEPNAKRDYVAEVTAPKPKPSRKRSRRTTICRMMRTMKLVRQIRVRIRNPPL